MGFTWNWNHFRKLFLLLVHFTVKEEQPDWKD